MNLFKSPLVNRIAVGKLVGLVFGLLCFIMLPVVFNITDWYLRFAILLWYISIGAIIGVMGVMDKHPLFNFSFSYWIRGTVLGGWMNFVLALFMYDKLAMLMQNTIFANYSPFFIIIEGMFVGFIIDLIATKWIGEGAKLMK